MINAVSVLTKEAPGVARPEFPVVLVPGFMASRLWSIPRLAITPPLIAWPLNSYSLAAQLLLLRPENRLEPAGLVRGYYENLLDFLCQPVDQGGLGHQTGHDLWIFPYDWRQSCQQTGQQLGWFIQQQLEKYNLWRAEQKLPPCAQVDIINHSLGGLVTRSAIKLYAAPVRRVVYLAAPHYGVAKAFFALHPDTVNTLVDDFVQDFIPGWYWDLLKTFPNIRYMQQWLGRLLAGLPAMYELLPDRYYLTKNNSLIIDASQSEPRPVVGLAETYYNHAWQLSATQKTRVLEAMRFKQKLGPTLPGTQNLVIYSATLPTYTHATYREGHLEHPVRLPVGDATVTRQSANHDAKATRLVIEGLHSRLPGLPEIRPPIKAFLSPTAPAHSQESVVAKSPIKASKANEAKK